MAVSLKKTILIGLGGTGIKSTVHIKRELVRQFGKVPPIVRILGFDTDVPQKQQLKLEEEDIYLEEDKEGFHITLDRPDVFVRENDLVKSWAPPERMISYQDISSGTGAERVSGRLALFANAPTAYGEIEKAWADITGKRAEIATENMGIEISSDKTVDIYIVCSVAGGTGSGMFLDTGYMCRYIAGLGHRVFGFFLLPGVFGEDALNYYCPGNGYAALKELDYWINQDQTVEVSYPGVNKRIPWGGGRGNKPFDYICLVDDETETRTVDRINRVDDAVNFMASSLFLHMMIESGTGSTGSFYPDLITLLEHQQPWKGKGNKPRYMGFGTSSLETPFDRTIDFAVDQTMIELIQKLLSGHFERAVVGEALDMYVAERLRIEDLAGNVFGVEPRAQASEPETKQPWRRTENASLIIGWKMTQVADFRNKCEKHANFESEAFTSAVAKVQSSVAEQVEHILDSGQGIEYAIDFLEELQAYLLNESQSLGARISDLTAQEAKMQNRDESVEDLINEAFQQRHRKQAVQKAIAEAKSLIRDWSGLNAKSSSAKVYKELLIKARRYIGLHIDQLKKLETLLTELERRFRYQTEMKRAPVVGDIFVTKLDKDFLDPSINQVKAGIGTNFLIQATKEKIEAGAMRIPGEGFSALTALNTLSLDDFISWLRPIIKNEFISKKADTIEDVFQQLAESEAGYEKTAAKILNFIKDTRAYWPVEVPPEAKNKIANLYVAALPDRPGGLDASPFVRIMKDNDMKEMHPALSWEKNRIRLLRLRVAAPLHHFRPLKDYKLRYLEIEGKDVKDRDFTHHIHKDWIGPNSILPDIFPEPHELDETGT